MKSYRAPACLIVAVLQPLAGTLAPVLGIGTPIGNATRNLGAPEQPPPVFFSIWAIIFAAFLLFALLLFRKREPWMIRVGAPLALAGLGNILWMLSAQLIASRVVDFVLLIPILAASWVAAARFDGLRGMGGSPAKLIADMATGLLAGWLLVATAISVPLLIRAFTTLGATDYPWQMLWTTLCIAFFGAWMFARYVSRSLWFFAALAWGLAGIIENNWAITGMGWLAIMTGVTGALVVALRLFRGADGTSVLA
ncbi:MAG: hypothetical protein R3C00_01185 [Hyphomonas sp.]